MTFPNDGVLAVIHNISIGVGGGGGGGGGGIEQVESSLILFSLCFP